MSSSPDPDARWLVRVDTGGTFTDGWAQSPTGEEIRCKVLSNGVLRTEVEECLGELSYRLTSDFGAADGLLKGFRARDGERVVGWAEGGRLLTLDRNPEWRVGDLVELTSDEEAPVLAARLMTATGLEEEFPPLDFRLATTRGTNALLERKGSPGVLLVTAGFEDLLRIRDQRRPELFSLAQTRPLPVFEKTIGVAERVSAKGEVLEELEEDLLRERLAQLRSEGISVAAVALLNSYANSVHEERVGELLEEAGFAHVSLSSVLTKRVRLLPRAETAVANAYLAPVMDCFVKAVSSRLAGGTLELMTSAGFLKRAEDYRPIDSLLSGPAGGVVGALAAAESAGIEHVLTFDMGGTSSDVARLEGVPSFRYEQVIGPVRVVAPAVQIETVAAGGGSICRWRNGGLEVGPDSAGADPGPACYGRGGPLTITDVNLLLGCMDAAKTGIPLDVRASQGQLEELQAAMRKDGIEVVGDGELLEGLRAIAVERMAEAIRKVSLREGFDPSEYTLVAFGGAGPQHACAVAEKLGVAEILIPGDAGLLSAWGLHRSARENIAERQVLRRIEEVRGSWSALLLELVEEACVDLGREATISRVLLELRLWGQDSALEVEGSAGMNIDELLAIFAVRYEALYGYGIPAGREVELVAMRVVATMEVESLAPEEFVEGAVAAERELQQDSFRTCVLEPGWRSAVGSRGSIKLSKEGEHRMAAGWTAEVEAELFRCRFESVVEEMGELLRRTAISTNVKERLDYSCALLDGEGRLVVNAPHIPVHLGALGVCVREVSKGRDWKDGDMLVVNHPGFGGSHLPDVTVVSPVIVDGALLAFVANRAHHAEIGGRTPGSMPATAASLEEEGVVIDPTLIFESGESRFKHVEGIFREAAFPSRMLTDNLADLAAQTASNHHGVRAVGDLILQASAEEVVRNMARLRERAAAVMRAKLTRHEGESWRAEDGMDDGTPICVEIECKEDGLRIDFKGSGATHGGNLNATASIVRSAVLYVLRAWVGEDLPLNEGLLEPVQVEVPEGILNPVFSADPSRCPAVVGGNVETSQRVVDVLLAALGLQANSQGSMNNVLFGNEQFGYYETIGGGSGAGPGWSGMSGTHVHMSNTAITDPEVLERLYPVRVREFSLRRGSGGRGKWQGGEGLVRELEFLESLTISVLTQRRTCSPRGARGGEDGAPGRQLCLSAAGAVRELPNVYSGEVQPGDRLRIETPGGGGWGPAVGEEEGPA